MLTVAAVGHLSAKALRQPAKIFFLKQPEILVKDLSRWKFAIFLLVFPRQHQCLLQLATVPHRLHLFQIHGESSFYCGI